MPALISTLRRRAPIAIAIAAFGASTACSDATGAGARGGLSLSVSTQGSAVSDVSSTTAGPLTITAGSNTLVITKAQVVMGEIELKSGLDGDCSRSGEGPGDCVEVELDPVLVDLPLDGMTQLDLGALVPPGTYHELEFEVDAVESDDRGAAMFYAAHPDFRNVSLRVEGTFNGEPFVFTSHEDTELELEFEPSIVIGEDGTNVTVSIDLGAWFRDSSGALVDPRDSGNSLLILSNIRSSFGAFEDRDRDGQHDGSGHH